MEGFDAMKNPFRVGDIIQYNGGTYDIRVENIVGERITGRYLHSNAFIPLRRYGDFRLIMTKDNTKQTKDTTMTTKLYEVTTDGATKYATKLATNSEGLWVLEESGTKLIFTAKAVDCQKVMPHTVSIKFVTGDSRQENTNNYDYFAKKGSVSVGDFIFAQGSSGLAIVTGVDTKSEMASKELTGYIMAATKIESN
jgi:hypothetical protein